MSERLLEKLRSVEERMNAFGTSYTQTSLQRAQKELSRYQEEIDGVRSDLQECQRHKKLDAEQAAQLERYVQALQYLNKQLAQLLGSYENIAEVQQVLQAAEVETVNKACRAVENLKIKAQTDAESGGPTDERLLERLLERDVNGVHRVWDDVKLLNHCVNVHIEHAAQYTEFYVRGIEYERTMPRVVHGFRERIWEQREPSATSFDRVPSPPEHDVDESPNATRTQQERQRVLIATVDELLGMLAYWWQRVEVLVQDSRRVVPVALREKPPEYKVPGTLLREFMDPEAGVALAQGEQVFVKGRVNRTLWNVETAVGAAHARKENLLVPAVYVVLRVPDLDAINLALVLRKHLLQQWTLCVRDCGIHVLEQIYFLYLEMRQLEDTLSDFALSSQPELRAWCHQVLNAVIQLRTATYQNTSLDPEALRALRQSMNAEASFFEFEAAEYAATTAGDEAMATEGAGAGAGPNGWQVPIRSRAYTERIEQKLFNWLLLADETRALRGHDLSSAMQLMDAVDYQNLVVTIHMITHLVDTLQLVFEYNALTDPSATSHLISQETVDKVAGLNNSVRLLVQKYHELFRMWDLCRGLLERQVPLDLVNENLLAELKAEPVSGAPGGSTSVLDVDELLTEILATETPETINLQLDYLREYARAQQSLAALRRPQPSVEKLFVTGIESARDASLSRSHAGAPARLYVDVGTGDVLGTSQATARRGENVDALLIKTHPVLPGDEGVLAATSLEPLEKTEYTLLVNSDRMPTYKPKKTSLPTLISHAPSTVPKEECVELMSPRLAAQVPLAAAVSSPRRTPDGTMVTQGTEPQEPEEESEVPCMATQTAAPFTSRPNKTNLHITHVYDTKDEKFLTKKQALKLGILNKETKQYISRATGQSVWIGDAIVKGYIKVAPRMYVQHPRIDLKFSQEEGAASASAADAAAAGQTPLSPTDKRGKYRVVAKV